MYEVVQFLTLLIVREFAMLRGAVEGASMVPSLQPRWGGPQSVASAQAKKTKKTVEPTSLSDEELRWRIYANAAVLFPSSNSQSNAYEIVYGTRPRPVSKEGGEENPYQYAMLVRRGPSGEFTPLMRGQAWSTDRPWSMALQGLLDVTATAIHKKLGGLQMPPLGVNEELPSYSPQFTRTITQ